LKVSVQTDFVVASTGARAQATNCEYFPIAAENSAAIECAYRARCADRARVPIDSQLRSA
jgi:hypothetical protein